MTEQAQAMERRQSLFEITEEVQKILDLVEMEMEASGGDVTEGTPGADLLLRLKEYQFLVREKLDAYASVIKVCEADAGVLTDEARRLQARAATFTNTAKRLKKLLHFAMLQLGTRSIKGLKFSAGIQKNGGLQPMKLRDNVSSAPLVSLAESDAIGAILPRFATFEVKWDMEALREAAAAGDEAALKVVELLPVGEHLRIR